jgi:hypothetical protein
MLGFSPVYKLAKLLFPKNPRMVRYRKLQLLFFSIFFSLLAATLVALFFYGTYVAGGRQ